MTAKVRRLTPYGRSVKKALIDREVSQAEIERRLGMPKRYLALILHGERSGEKYRAQLSRELGLPEPEREERDRGA